MTSFQADSQYEGVMKIDRILGLHSEMTPDLEIEFEDRTSEWINKTFQTGLIIISAVMWIICLTYLAYGFNRSILVLALGCQVLMAYGYFTTCLKGAARRVVNIMTPVFPVAYIFGFMSYYVPQLPKESLIFQSQAWIIWVVMLIYAIERLSPILAAFSAVLASSVYFYLRFKVPQLQDAPYLQVAVQLIVANLTGFIIVVDHTRKARSQFKLKKELEAERVSSDKLLRNVLPTAIVAELKSQEATIAQNYENVTVLFADLVGFTKTAATMDSKLLVKLLDELFSRFDALAEQHGIEKIKTIGDAYMAAAGCPESDPKHAVRMTHYALELDGVIQRFNGDFGTTFALKVGLSSGAVIGGVIGKKRISFDLWGDVVNLASRIEAVASSGEVMVSESTAKLINQNFDLNPGKIVDLKGKGPTLVFSVKRVDQAPTVAAVDHPILVPVPPKIDHASRVNATKPSTVE
jgi:class 3 adenylate cyclase